jgi:predicted HD phosphohydrolase
MKASEVEAVGALFAGAGRRRYLGEPISVADHLLQCAALADEAGDGEELVLAALLHDLGYLLDPPSRVPHEERAAAHLAGSLPEGVLAPVRLHVAAKRYLCAAEEDYHSLLGGLRSPSPRRGGAQPAALRRAGQGPRPRRARLRRLQRPPPRPLP